MMKLRAQSVGKSPNETIQPIRCSHAILLVFAHASDRHSQLQEESAFQMSTNEEDERVCFDKANAKEIRSGAS